MGFFDSFGNTPRNNTNVRGKVASAQPHPPAVDALPIPPIPPDNPPPAPTPPAPEVPITPEGTNAFFGSIMSNIDKVAQPNSLNAYLNPTYHFRLFMTEDTDIITATKATSLLDFNQKVLLQKQVTIAESGVTGFNIQSVRMTTVAGATDLARADKGTVGTIVITEQNGISFLDGLHGAAEALGVKNFTKAVYLLELKFMGYSENGEMVTAIDTKGVGNRFIWGIVINEIQVNLTEGGGAYTITFAIQNYGQQGDQFDVFQSPANMRVSGQTLGELFKDYVDQMNKYMSDLFGGPLIKIDGIYTSDIGKFFPAPAHASSKNLMDFRLVSQEKDKDPSRNTRFKDGKYVAYIRPGYRVQDFILDAIKHTEEGQNLVIDNGNARTQVDHTASATNERNLRQSIIWNVEPTVSITQFDNNSKQYMKVVKFFVTPHYSHDGLQTPEQAARSNTPDAQRLLVTSLIQNGLLRKKYDYVYTGLNTEILEFDMSFKTNVNMIQPMHGGALMKFDAYSVAARTSTATPDGGNPSKLQTHIDPVATGGSTGDNVYMEDILNSRYARKSSDYPTTISFWKGYKPLENEAGMQDFTGQHTPDQSIVGAIWSQIYKSAKTSSYSNPTMTIRGDPYWLGQTNLFRQINLLFDNVSSPKSPTPDWVTGSQYLFLTFQYPIQMGDDFKPLMRTSQLFNGLYSVTTVDHIFADGVFKQTLHCASAPLANVGMWDNPNGTNGGNPSSTQMGQSTSAPGAAHTPGSLGFGDGKGFAQQAGPLVNRLMNDFGLTAVQAAGIVGNLGQESGLRGVNEANPVVDGSQGGFGWAQWTGPRRDAYFAYVRAHPGLDAASPEANYGFLKQDLSGPYASTITAVKQQTTIEGATAAFETKYEVAGNVQMDNRVAYAQQALNLSTTQTASN